uniref:Proto-oncogene tyrosine-protein kinase ROS n=1 Tax=Lygus hesperus TaxID=30085 RepID=A0A0A9ZFH4_LYGHE
MIQPVMRKSLASEPGLVADIKIHGMWDRERTSFYDIRVINADASSYSSQDWLSVAKEASRSKHRKYDAAAEDLHGSFGPLITSCEGVWHREFQAFARQLVGSLAAKWDKPRSTVAGFVRTKLQMATIRAISLRLRESRKCVRHIT